MTIVSKIGKKAEFMNLSEIETVKIWFLLKDFFNCTLKYQTKIKRLPPNIHYVILYLYRDLWGDVSVI